MKVAVVSDIHGNVKALKSFLKYIDEEKIDTVLNLGDIMGGEDPFTVLKIIMKDKRFINVCGNHDQSFLYIEEELNEEEKKWLLSLPLHKIVDIEGRKFLMLHSRIDDNESIPLLYDEGNLTDFLKDYEGEYDYVLFGHTHYQCLLSFYEGKTMINPGSLGLSYDEQISFVVIDVNRGKVDILFKKEDN